MVERAFRDIPLESTGNFSITVAVMVGAVVSSAIVRLAFGYSFSTWSFQQRDLDIRSPHDIGLLANWTVSKLMRTDPKLALATMPLREVREKFPLGSAKRIFVVT